MTTETRLTHTPIRPLDRYEWDLARWTQLRKRSPIVSSQGKERPKCRRAIVARNLVPYPAPNAWDGMNAFGDDCEVVSLSDGMRAQMRRMIVEGYWS